MKNTISYLLRLYRKVRTIESRLFKSSDSNIRISSDAVVFKTSIIKAVNNGIIEINNCFLNNNTFICANGGNIKLEKRVTINRNSILVSRKGIVIGEGTSIGPNVCVYDHDHKFDCNGFKKDEFKMGKIIIGKNVWIAANCCILKNTQIGDNCIIGAGTVVSGVIPPNSIVHSTRELIVEKLL